MHGLSSIRERQADVSAIVEVEAVPPSPPLGRSVYAPSSSGRLIGVIGTALIYLAVVAGFFLFTLSYDVPDKGPSALAVFDVRPPASPPDTLPEDKEAPKPVQKREREPQPQQVRPIEPPKFQISQVSAPVPVAAPKPADPSPREPETAAPKTLPAPPAPQISSNARDTWESRVLAQLAENRRYPSWAMSRREQGVPYVRIVIDREGKVLSSRLERSCGFPDLDREAVALPKRASPLPRPPDDKPGDTLELVVPIEFLLRTR